MKEFINKYKSEIIIALGAITSICTTLIAEGTEGIGAAIIIAIVAVLVEVLKNGFSETTINLIAKAIMIIISEVSSTNNVVSASEEETKELTIDDIKELLKD